MTIREMLAKINEGLESDYGVAMYKSGCSTSKPEFWAPRKWEYWGKSYMRDYDSLWPEEGRLLVYIVPGNSEGYYLHADYETFGNKKKDSYNLLLGKILGPIEDGFAVLLALTKMFDWTHPKTCMLPD